MYPKRLLLADARRRGVPILPLDVNKSGVAHRIELVSESRREKVWGLRLALSDVHGISEAEAERIAEGQPYASLLDFWERARPAGRWPDGSPRSARWTRSAPTAATCNCI